MHSPNPSVTFTKLEVVVGLAAVVFAIGGYLLDSLTLEFFAVLATAVASTLVVARVLLTRERAPNPVESGRPRRP